MQYTNRKRAITTGSRQKAGTIHNTSIQKGFTSTGHDSYSLFVGDTVINIRFNKERSLTTCLAKAFSTIIS